MGRYRPDLQANVDGLHYDFNERTGALHMPLDSCTDMNGCIALFKTIDSEVEKIVTTSGEFFDNTYRKNSDGEWNAERPVAGYDKVKWALPYPNLRKA